MQNDFLSLGFSDKWCSAALESLLELAQSEFGFICELLYQEDGKPILNDEILLKENQNETSNVSEDNRKKADDFSEIENEIVSILDEYIKPAVASDGGHIAFDSFDESSKTVRVILQGACSGCPSSTITLKNGIETMLREMLNGRVTTVEAING